MAEVETLWLLCIEVWSTRFTSKFSLFTVIAGWTAEMLLFAYIAV